MSAVKIKLESVLCCVEYSTQHTTTQTFLVSWCDILGLYET